MENKIKDFQLSFCPWGYLDIKRLIEEAEESNKDVDWCVEQINNFKDDIGIKIYDDIDPVYVIFDSLHQEARTEIENATGKDICNDSPYSSICISGNYCATSLDWENDDNEKLKELIDTMQEKSPVVVWLYNQL